MKLDFKKFMDLDEHKFNNHGGKRHNQRTFIRMAAKSPIKKPFMGIIHHKRNKA
jgi:hypothetical protein